MSDNVTKPSPLPRHIYANIKLLYLVGILPGGDVHHALAQTLVAAVLELQGRPVAAPVLVLHKADLIRCLVSGLFRYHPC